MSTTFSATNLKGTTSLDTPSITNSSGANITLNSKNLTSVGNITSSGLIRSTTDIEVDGSLLTNSITTVSGGDINLNSRNLTSVNQISIANDGSLTSGLRYTGTLSGTTASSSVTLANPGWRVGTITFTGRNLNANSTLTLTIDGVGNFSGTAGIVSMTCSASPATDLSLYIQSATWTTGTLVVVIANGSATALVGESFQISFISFD